MVCDVKMTFAGN